MTLGQRIQELRKQAGMSQEGLGEALGVSRQAVSKWEGDNGIPELDTLIAMSRLFGITVGQLLGVEAPEEKVEEPPLEAAPGFTEEQVEEILRRYAEESRRQEPEKERKYPAGSWIIAGCVVVAAVILLVVSIGKVRGVISSVSDLQSRISFLQSELSNMRVQVGGLSNELREVLEEQSSLLSTFDLQVVDFDVEQSTVDVELTATLKEYNSGDALQFVLEWTEVDQEAGQLVCDPVSGPDFAVRLTIPMNFHLSVSVRVLGDNGGVKEQEINVIYGGMHPDIFTLQFRGFGTWLYGDNGKIGYDVELYSEWPDRIWPVKTEVVVLLNGQEIARQEETLSEEDGAYFVRNEIEIGAYDHDRDEVEIRAVVTDNYGRETTSEVYR